MKRIKSDPYIDFLDACFMNMFVVIVSPFTLLVILLIRKQCTLLLVLCFVKKIRRKRAMVISTQMRSWCVKYKGNQKYISL